MQPTAQIWILAAIRSEAARKQPTPPDWLLP